MDPRWLARFTSVARLAIGAGFVLVPELAMRPWIGSETRRERARLLARVIGSRDLVLAAGALTAGGQAERSRWIAAGLAADAADLVLTVSYRRVLPRRGAALVCAIAGAGVCLGSAALSAPRPVRS